MRNLYKYLVKGNKLFTDSLWNSGGYIFTNLLSLLSVPLLIKYIGLNDYGIYVLFSTVIGFMSISNPGLEETIIKYISEFKSKNEKENMSKTINSIFIIYIFISCTVALIIFILISLLDVSPQKINGSDLHIDLGFIFSIGFIIYFLNKYFISVLKGYELFKIYNLNVIIKGILLVLTGILIARETQSVSYVLLGQIIIVLLFNIVLFLYLTYKNKINITLTFDYQFFKDRLLYFSKWIWSANILGIVQFNIDKLMVAALMGLEALSIYHIAIRMAHLLIGLVSKSLSNFLPFISGKSQDLRFIENFFINANRILSYFVSGLMIFLFYSSPYLLTLWLGEDLALKVLEPFRILLIYAGFATTSTISYNVFNGMGYAKMNAYVSFFGVTFTLLMILTLGFLFSFWGIIIGRITNSISTIIARTVTYNYVFKRKRYFIALNLMFPLIVVSILILLSSSFISLL